MHDGQKRMCPECGEVKESKFFPFPKRQECYLCYEKVTGTHQRAFRRKLGISYINERPAKSRYEKAKICYKCQVCGSQYNYNFVLCEKCGTYDSSQIVSTKKIDKIKSITAQEKPIEKNILELYLQSCDAYSKPLVIRYQSKRKNSAKHWRTIYMDSYDDTYIITRNQDNIPIRYRRDRVVEIKY